MAKFRKSGTKILKDFCNNTSVNSCNFFTMKNVLYNERILWAILSVIMVILTIYHIYYLCNEYTENPIVVTLVSSNLPIQDVKHPGVSICHTNKISKKRAREFAEYLNKFIKSKNVSTIMEDVKLLGSFYDFTVPNQESLRQFQEILNMYDNFTDEFDPTRRLLHLTPSCHDMMKKCVWGGKVYPCEDLFLTRMTFEGFCCVFNYLKPYRNKNLYKDMNSRDAVTRSEVPKGPGIENGLQITLFNDPDDYFYTVAETTGFNIHIFYPEDFPDKLSGSLTEILVNANQEALINIDVDVIRSSTELQLLPIHLRGCKFEDDDTTIFGKYRESDCYVGCKIKTMISLCDCVPFMIRNTTVSGKRFSPCTLVDIPCLNKHMGKWIKYYPHGANPNDFQRELHDSLSCEQCLPPCNNVHYNVYTSLTGIDKSERYNGISHISVFFKQEYCNVYKIDLISTWFEKLSSFGGVLSLFLGLSVISVIEICVLGYKLITYILKGS